MAWTPYYSEGWQSGEAGGTPITPEALNHMDDGIAGAVEKTGDEMTGNLTLPHLNVQSGDRYSNIHFRDSNNVPRAMMWGDGQTGRLFFRSIHPDVAAANVGSIYTEYYLYQSALTSGSVSYRIYSERDTIPVDHGGTGATGAYDAAENLGLAMAFNGSDWTLATMYPKMIKVPVPGSALLWLSPTSVGRLSGNAISAYCTCIASRTGPSSWRFMAFNGSGDVFVWDMSNWTSASATPTIGTIRRVAVPQTQDVTATTDTNGNISLGLAAANYHVLSAKSSSRIVTPWVSGDDSNWHARVTGVNGNATASTSVTVTVIYTLV
ncbi:MAG: hypothetical protein IKP10_03555 [Clostridia bacterium]|nr:hypothetical protein [Clostridia bacterium]